jgi:hypothetical protein
VTNTQIFRARCPRVSSLSASLTTGIIHPELTCASYDGDRPSRTHLQDALSARPPLWQSHDDVWSSSSHECPSVDGYTARPLLHPAVSDQSELCPGPGTCSQAPPTRHMALILLSSWSSMSLLLAGTHVVLKFVEVSDN